MRKTDLLPSMGNTMFFNIISYDLYYERNFKMFLRFPISLFRSPVSFFPISFSLFLEDLLEAFFVIFN